MREPVCVAIHLYPIGKSAVTIITAVCVAVKFVDPSLQMFPNTVLLFSTSSFFLCKTDALYQFFKLLNVTIFAVYGIVGVIFLAQGMKIVSAAGKEGASPRRWVLWLWVLVYAFVGSQMARAG